MYPGGNVMDIPSATSVTVVGSDAAAAGCEASEPAARTDWIALGELAGVARFVVQPLMMTAIAAKPTMPTFVRRTMWPHLSDRSLIDQR
jgi:hypothetical protein